MKSRNRTETKRSKRDELRAERERRQRIRRLLTFGIPGLIIAAIAGFLIYKAATNPRPGPVAGERSVPSEGQGHVPETERATYANNPPSSGQHYGNTAGWGYNDVEVQPEYWLHNLEHGGVVFLYNCPTDCPELKDQLRTLAATIPPSKYGYPKLIVTSYASALPGEVVAVAWTRELDLARFDAKALTDFYRRYVDRGPEDVG